jgi:hypothetical protein
MKIMVSQPQTAKELRDQLYLIFPDYRAYREGNDNSCIIANDTFNFHSLLIDFAVFVGQNKCAFSKKQFQSLAAVLNVAVEQSGLLETAVSTCFLEHLYQLELVKVLRPFLSKAVLKRLHA